MRECPELYTGLDLFSSRFWASGSRDAWTAALVVVKPQAPEVAFNTAGPDFKVFFVCLVV